jgi:hypothetical protein
MKKTIGLSICFVCIITIVTLLSISSVAGNQIALQKSHPTQTVDQLPAFPITIDNSLGSELVIQNASSKEVSKTQYAMLTGEESEFTTNSTYPDVTLVNRSGKTIKSFALMVRSIVDKAQGGHVMIKYNLGLAPGDTHMVTAKQWPMPERKTVQKGEKFVNVVQKPGLDSAKAWLPGSSNDLKVTVGLVEFEDGTRWIIPNVKW